MTLSLLSLALAFLAFGLWTLAAVLVGAWLSYRRVEGQSPLPGIPGPLGDPLPDPDPEEDYPPPPSASL